MNIIPNADEARELRTAYANNIVIDMAEDALRTFGARDVETAAVLLPHWRHAPGLTPREMKATLVRFMPATDPDPVGWFEPSPGGNVTVLRPRNSGTEGAS